MSSTPKREGSEEKEDIIEKKMPQGEEDDPNAGFTDQEAEILRHHFDQVDDDGSGEIDKKEFTEFYTSVMGAGLTKREIGEIFDRLDEDGGGTLSFSEFLSVYRAMVLLEAVRKDSSKQYLLDEYCQKQKKAMTALQAANAFQSAGAKKLGLFSPERGNPKDGSSSFSSSPSHFSCCQSLANQWFYCHINEPIKEASQGQFPNATDPNQDEKILRLPSSYDTAYLTRQLTSNFEVQLRCRKSWDRCLGNAVRSRNDPNSKGILRWVGLLSEALDQTHNHPDKSKRLNAAKFELVVGIEWRVEPRGTKAPLHKETTLTAGDPLLNSSFPAHHMTGDLARNMDVSFRHAAAKRRQSYSAPCSGGTQQRPLWYHDPEDILFRQANFQRPLKVPKPTSFFGSVLEDHEASGSSGGVSSDVGARMQKLDQWDESFRKSLLLAIPPKLIGDLCTLSLPLVLKYFIEYLTDQEETPGQSSRSEIGRGLLYVAIILVTGSLSSLLNHKHLDIMTKFGGKLHVATIGLILQKIFKVSRGTLTTFRGGNIITMVGADVDNIQKFFMQCHNLWSGPLQLLIGWILLYHFIGVSALAGLGAFLLLIPIEIYIFKKQAQLKHKALGFTDHRMETTNELLSSIKHLKMMGLENHLAEKIRHWREHESEVDEDNQIWKAAASCLSHSTTGIVLAVILLVFHALGNSLRSAVVFPTLSVLFLLRSPLLSTFKVVNIWFKYRVSTQRVTQFIEAEEPPEPWHVDAIPDQELSSHTPKRNRQASMTMYRTETFEESKLKTLGAFLDNVTLANFVWSHQEGEEETGHEPHHPVSSTTAAAEGGAKKEEVLLLHREIIRESTFRFEKGKLTMIFGPSGCGKSTLLRAFIGEIEVTAGKVYAPQKIAYVNQQPWLFDGTIKENIHMMQYPVDEERLADALFAMDLDQEMEALPAGLDTRVGQGATNTSAGQRVRIALARAIYSDAQLYLFDDPLALVDVHHEEHIISLLKTKLRGKTHILVTHQVQHLQSADSMILLDQNGQLSFQGEYSDFLDFAGHIPGARSFMGMEGTLTSHAGNPTWMQTPSRTAGFFGSVQDSEGDSTDEDSEDGFEDDIDCSLGDSLQRAQTVCFGAMRPQPQSLALNQMMEEEKVTGWVSKDIYKHYAQQCLSLWSAIGLAVFFIVTEVIIVSGSIWLSLWTENKLGFPKASDYLYIYCAIVACTVVGSSVRAWLVHNLTAAASDSIHDELLAAVVDAKLSFFDATPIGRLTNRFSKDTDVIDADVPEMILELFELGLALTSSLIVMAFSQPVILILVLVMALIYSRIFRTYSHAYVEIKRVHCVVQSPIYATISSIAAGHRLIVGYNCVKEFFGQACKQLNSILSAFIFLHTTNRWVRVRLDVLGNLLVASMALSAVICKGYDVGSKSVSLLSLGITLSLNVLDLLNRMVVQNALVQTGMNSVERVLSFSRRIEREGRWVYDEKPDDSFDESEWVVVDSDDGKADKGNASTAPSIQSMVTIQAATSEEAEKQPLLMKKEEAAPEEDAQREKQTIAATKKRYRPVFDKPPSIKFSHVSVQYDTSQTPVLEDINLEIFPGEKVALVGKSGSGKSTLLLALLKLVNIVEGDISIGGFSLKDSFSPVDLRNQFSIIPQEPTLFHHSVRYNLNPFHDQTTDEEFCRVLIDLKLDELLTTKLLKESQDENGSRCESENGDLLEEQTSMEANANIMHQMSTIFEAQQIEKTAKVKLPLDQSHSSGEDSPRPLLNKEERKLQRTAPLLDLVVHPEHFSIGEKQLFAVARAALRKTSVCIMLDDATNSLSNHQDTLVHKTLQAHTKNKIVILATHRLHTALDCDRLVVLQDNGQIAEEGDPLALASDANSVLRELISLQGAQQEKKLMKQVSHKRQKLSMARKVHDIGLKSRFMRAQQTDASPLPADAGPNPFAKFKKH